jgi:glutaredoxin 3
MANARVVVYSTVYCEFSRAAKALLKDEGIPFDNVDVTNDPRARAELAARAHGRQTVPVIFVDGKPIGGYQELADLVRAGKLEHITRAA